MPYSAVLKSIGIFAYCGRRVELLTGTTEDNKKSTTMANYELQIYAADSTDGLVVKSCCPNSEEEIHMLFKSLSSLKVPAKSYNPKPEIGVWHQT